MNTGAAGLTGAVLVVGGGPVGLSAALALRAAELPVLVLEAGPVDRARPGSRAIFIHRESLSHLEIASPGLGREIAAHGLVWSTKRTFWGERQVYERTYPPPDGRGLPHSTNLPQVTTERLLLDACKAAGVEFAWDAEVTAVESRSDGVRLEDAGGRKWQADFVVAADGARSAVRRQLAIPMEGSRSENAFVIVDVAEEDGAARRPERVFYYHHPAVGGRNVLLVPFAGGWRADLQCRGDDRPEDFSDPDGVRQWIGRVLDPSYADRVSWVSTYRFLQMVAANFTDSHRRVLLVGEAAHLFAPFGARGLNSGVADAVSAAAAIRAAAERPSVRSEAVDAFAAERRRAALYNRSAAGAALAHMQASDLRTRAARAGAALLARAGQRAGAWLDSAPYGPRADRRRGSDGTY
ncbi:MAG TPA: FAD-dependent monooxygenase [Acidimicrobiales bacterium]|nr:FAD-dependent monooxygenase [Acidimicrobiales bacterium]